MNARNRLKLIIAGTCTIFGGALAGYFGQDESEFGKLSYLNVILGVAMVGICACTGVHMRDARREMISEATPPVREEPVIQPPPPPPVSVQVTDLRLENPGWTNRVQQERQQVVIHVARV